MSTTIESPPLETPDAGVIEDARARQHRQRRVGIVALVVTAAIGVLAWFEFGGGGGVPRGARPADDGGGTLSARSSGSASARFLASALLPPYAYQLAVQDGRIAVTGTQAEAGGCATRLLDPKTLRVDSIIRRCSTSPTTPPSAPKLVIVFRTSGTAIRVATTSAVTHKVTIGPTLLTLPEWNWAHSGVALGDGELWIYGLGGQMHGSTLLEISASNGRLVHRFAVSAGPNPFMAVDADGFWITESAWGGGSCATACTLWHVAPGSARLVAVRTLGIRTQWLMASGHSIDADVLNSVPGGFRQTIWRLDGSQANIAHITPATLLPSTDFSFLTGYVVVGNTTLGYFTITQLGGGTTPAGVGVCDTAAPVRVVQIDPLTGRQSYVATLPRNLAGAHLDCHLSAHQAVFDAGSLYLLVEQSGAIPDYQRVVRVTP